MSRSNSALFVALLAVSTLVPMAAPAQTPAKRTASGRIPAHPRDVRYPPLTYAAPDRAAHRHVLPSGVVVHVVPDRTASLVDVTVKVRAGAYLDVAGKEGLASAVASQVREGGAGALDAEAFDEELAFLAADFDSAAAGREATAHVNVLSKDLGAGLDLFFAALREPRFQADRLELWRSRTLQALSRRNDDTAQVEGREWDRLMFGADHFEARQPTSTSVGSLTRDDLVGFHQRFWHPGNLVVAVSGDVLTAEVLAQLERRFAAWPKGEAAPEPPKPTAPPAVGVRLVNKPDVNQTRVTMGHRGTTWDTPDAVALQVMNAILGGGGFTSRIMERVRSDEGLAYQAATMIAWGRTYPGTYRVVFQSKNRSVARAAAIVTEELARIQREPVSETELRVAKANLVDGFPARFTTARRTAEVFLEDELMGRPADWWKTYRDRVSAVTAADVQAAARNHLHPDQVLILAVGKIEEAVAGDPEHPEHSLAGFAGPAGLVEIPLPDPSTLARPVNERPWPGR